MVLNYPLQLVFPACALSLELFRDIYGYGKFL
jgi:hypothetical protein